MVDNVVVVVITGVVVSKSSVVVGSYVVGEVVDVVVVVVSAVVVAKSLVVVGSDVVELVDVETEIFFLEWFQNLEKFQGLSEI